MRKNKKLPPELLNSLTIFLALSFFILATRGSHLLSSFSFPDAAFIVMLASGLFLRKLKWVVLLITLSIVIDLYMLPLKINEPYQLNLGYFGLITAYFFAWFIGKRLENILPNNSSIIKYSALYLIGTYLISSLSFYFFSGWAMNSKNVFTYIGLHLPDFMISNIGYLIIFFLMVKIYSSNKHNASILKAKSI